MPEVAFMQMISEHCKLFFALRYLMFMGAHMLVNQNFMSFSESYENCACLTWFLLKGVLRTLVGVQAKNKYKNANYFLWVAMVKFSCYIMLHSRKLSFAKLETSHQLTLFFIRKTLLKKLSTSNLQMCFHSLAIINKRTHWPILLVECVELFMVKWKIFNSHFNLCPFEYHWTRPNELSKQKILNFLEK